METRIAIIGIIVKNWKAVDSLNDILHDHGTYIIGRMGLPYHKKSVNIITIVIDAPQDIIDTISEKIGNLDGISSKVVYSQA